MLAAGWVAVRGSAARPVAAAGRMAAVILIALPATMGIGGSVGGFAVEAARAQTAEEPARVSGFVRDSTSGEALIGANVYLRDTNRGTATNASGFYAIGGVPPGEYELAASFIGYRTEGQTIELEPGEDLQVDLALVPEDVEIGEVVVSADREATEPQQIGSASLEAARITEIPALLEPDVFRALQLLPGVKAASDYQSGLYIRGGSPDQTLILLDGTTVYNPTHFFGLFSTFNPDAIKDVQLYKGTYPADYGGRLGSVVDIRNKDGNRREYAGTASVGLLAARAMVEGPVGEGSWMLAARRSTLEPVLAVLQSQDVDGIPEGFYFYDLNGKVNWDLSRSDKLSLAGYAGTDELDFPFSDQLNIHVRYGNRTLTGTWTHVASDAVFTRIQGTLSRYFSRPRFALGSTPFERRNGVWDGTMKGRLEWALNDRHQLQAGGQGGLFSFSLEESFDEQQRLDFLLTSWYGSFYLKDTYSPTVHWELEGGVRGSFFGRGDYYRLAPRFSTEYRYGPGLRFQAGYGRYYQYKSLISSGVFSGLDLWLTSGEGVAPAYGDQWGLGVKLQPGAGTQVEIEGYYRTMRDLFELDPRLSDPAGLDYHELFHVGDGYAYGLETLVRRRSGVLTGHVGYTFGITRRGFPDLNGGAPYPPKFDRTHQVQGAITYRLTDHWSLSTVGTWATGQAYTRPSARYQTVDDPFQSEPRTVLVADFNEARLPAYHRLDLGLSRTGQWFGALDYTLKAQVVNVYGHRNIWFYLYESASGGSVDRTEVPQIPVALPNISLTVDW